VSQEITVTDNQPPSIQGQIYIVLSPGSPIDSAYVTVTDNCSTYTITYEDQEVSGGNVIRTYTAADECGNISTFIQILDLPYPIEYFETKTVTMCRCIGNDTWMTIHVSPQEVQHQLIMGSYIGRCRIKDYQNQAIPLRMHIEIARDGSIRKFVK
jgi:hypothetical protein